MFRSIPLIFTLLANTAIAETDQFRSGWQAAIEFNCKTPDLSWGQTGKPQFANLETERGWQAAHADLREVIARETGFTDTGIMEGAKLWCTDPWGFYPEGAPKFH